MDIAVVAITVFKDKCLFLKRNFNPKNWCPPCGRLEKEEEPIDGVKREVFEEIGVDTFEFIDTEPIHESICGTDGKTYLNIFFIAILGSTAVTAFSCKNV